MTDTSLSAGCSALPMTTTAATNAAIAVVAPTARQTSTTNQNHNNTNINNNNSTINHINNSTNHSNNNNINNNNNNHQTQNANVSSGIVKNQPPVKLQNNIIHVAAPRHILHQHFHQIATSVMQPSVGQWPLVDPVFHFGPGFEHQHYCPTHSQGPQPQEHVVFFHINPGVSVTFQIGGNREIIRGPATVPMVSQSGSPPIAMPVQVPAGHIMQQIVDENGTLRHVILSTAQHQQIHGQNVVQNVHQSHMQGHYISTNNAAPHFFNAMPANMAGPGVGVGPYFHPMPPPPPNNHIPPQQIPQQMQPPPPTGNYHKDERTVRQHTKMLKKLENQQKQKEINSNISSPVPSPSPRKCEINGVGKRVINIVAPPSQQQPPPPQQQQQHQLQPPPPPQPIYQQQQQAALPLQTTMPSVNNETASTTDSVDSSSTLDQEDDEVLSIVEQLSTVQSPSISEVTPRSALLQWQAPLFSENTTVNVRDLRYEVLLSDRGKEGKYKIIFKGASLSCRIRDLRPGQEYSVCLQVYLGENQGSASDAAIFTTPSCEPDPPLPPKLIARTKNSLQLRWNATIDNGAHIQHYILEYDEGKGNEFIEVIKMKSKQYSLSKLQPSTWYSFRLAAVNECGKSNYSDIITYSTAGNPPLQLLPPILQRATSATLCVSWTRRTEDEDFVLQIADCETGHGFLTAYTGRDTVYECTNLKRATAFQFRIRAENEAGASIWSEPIAYETLAERPSRPQKPHVKGKMGANRFKAKWEPPIDKGGTDISVYYLEINGGDGYETIYKGRENEAVCDRLNPGSTYHIRVACENSAGVSPYSEVCTIVTDPIVPAAPPSPYLGNAPGPYAAVLQWKAPDYNGGAPVLEYEVEIEGSSGAADDRKLIHKSKDMYCVAKDLHPGERYAVQVRAINRIGVSGWSDALIFNAGSAPPFAPEMPDIIVRSSSQLTVQWTEPFTNGAPIKNYILVKVEPIEHDDNNQRPTLNVSPIMSSGGGGGNSNSSSSSNSNSRNICYQGAQTSADIVDLLPFSKYYFKVCAVNSSGESPFSPIAFAQTLRAAPGAPTITTYTTTPTEITLRWREPISNGAPIISYTIDCASNSIDHHQSHQQTISTETNVTEWTVINLQPRTKYNVRVQAVNEIGAGQFSSAYGITTNSLPPKAPRLECSYCGYKSLVLKWAERPSSEFTYQLQMIDSNHNGNVIEWRTMYTGNNYTAKLLKLQERTDYTFRICARDNLSEFGEYSDEYTFRTRCAPPKSIKEPDVIELADALRVEWPASKNPFGDVVEYILQIAVNKKDFKEYYRGYETSFTLEKVHPQTYMFRVCPVRIDTETGEEIKGTFSPIVRHKIDRWSNEQRRTSAALVEHTNGMGIGISGNNLAANLHGGSNSNCIDASGANGSNTNTATTSCTSRGGKIFTNFLLSYSNRKKFTDQEKAIMFAIFFMVLTVGFASIVKMLIS